ncbi:MAG: hypothetical protein JOZ14_10185 [Acidobacteria bacterium]|nr:hypothetical protein [Acidobacteriota bacterium]
MLRIEMAFILLSLLIAWLWPTLAAHRFEKLERGFVHIAEHRILSVVAVGIVALALRILLLPILPCPEPIVHDEFGYLLAGDTFAHGRLTNPTHPMWQHFETFHVMFHPTYGSIYPPAQGLFLALGKVLAGNAFWGVWLSVGLMCATTTWMLQGWMAPSWALLGGLFAILRYGLFGYWANSYWGGAVAAIGGGLALGALPRIQKFQRIRDSVMMGIGVAILSNSRPYEGGVLTLAIAVMMVAWLLGRNRPPLRVSLSRVALPLAAVVALAGVGTGYYLWRVTGNPFRIPYQIERQTYAVAPYMIWQPVRPEPTYHHAAMRKMFVEEETLGMKVFRSPLGLLLRAYLAWAFFLGPALSLPIVLLAIALPRGFSLRRISGRTARLTILLATSALGSVLVNFYSPHYSAPVTALVLALVLICLRALRRWGEAGLFLSRAVPIICALSLLVRAGATPLHIPLHQFYEFNWFEKAFPSFGRADIQKQLESMPGQHLVIVNYKPDHEPFAEWVYNAADIDKAKIVWAREMDAAENRKLVDYFNGRRVWLLQADETPPKLSPYFPR